MKVYELKKFLKDKACVASLKRPIKVSNNGIEHYLSAKIFESDVTDRYLYLIFTRKETHTTGEELLKIIEGVPDTSDIQLEVEECNPTKREFDVDFMAVYNLVETCNSDDVVIDICVRLLERIMVVF